MTRHSEVVSDGSVTIETFIEGDGQDVVILPSYGRSGGDDFDAFSAILVRAGYRVLRPQPRGVAASRGRMTGITLSDFGDEVAWVIQKLGNGPAVVLGHAFGNIVARATASDHPTLVSAIILAAASGRHVTQEVNAAPFIAGDPTLPEQERLAALKLAFFAPGQDPAIWLRGWYPQTLQMQRNAVTAAISDGLVDRYWTAGTAPVLEIIAEYDPFHPRDQWDHLTSRLGSRVTTTVIGDASHALFPEQPNATASAVIGYLQNLPSYDNSFPQ